MFLISRSCLFVHISCPQIYALSAAFLVPDVIFYTKLVVELVDWGAERPAWAKSDWSCGLWQVRACHSFQHAYRDRRQDVAPEIERN